MNLDILMLFDKTPTALPLYEAAEAKIMEAFPDMKIKVGKTQVGLLLRAVGAVGGCPCMF